MNEISSISIFHVKSNSIPHLRFEYHPQVRKLYIIKGINGALLAEQVSDNREALAFCRIFVQGYHEGKNLNLTIT